MMLRRPWWIGLVVAGCASPHRAVAPLAYVPKGALARSVDFLGDPPSVELPGVPACVDWKKATLSNGVPVWIAERHGFPSAAVRLVVATGETSEGDFGDPEFERREMVAGAFLASHANAAGKVRCSEVACSADDAIALPKYVPVGQSMDRLAEPLRRPTADPLDADRFVTAAEKRRAEQDSLTEAIWRNAGRLALGWRTDRAHGRLTGPTLDEVIATRARMFQPAQTTIFVAGDVSAADVVVEAQRAFGPWQPTTVPAAPGPNVSVREPREPAFVPRVAFVQTNPSLQPFSAVVVRGPSAGSADAWAFRAALQILGGGMQSKIFERVREEMAAAYVPGARVRWMRNASIALLGGPVERRRAIAVTREVLALVRSLRDSGPRDDELARARTVLRSTLATEASVNRGLVAGDDLTGSDLLPTDPCGVAKTIDAVTIDEVRSALKTYFAETRLGVLVVARDDQLEAWPSDLDLGRVARRDWYGNDVP